jgi:hypothetical protein
MTSKWTDPDRHTSVVEAIREMRAHLLSCLQGHLQPFWSAGSCVKCIAYTSKRGRAVQVFYYNPQARTQDGARATIGASGQIATSVLVQIDTLGVRPLADEMLQEESELIKSALEAQGKYVVTKAKRQDNTETANVCAYTLEAEPICPRLRSCAPTCAANGWIQETACFVVARTWANSWLLLAGAVPGTSSWTMLTQMISDSE